MTSAVTPANHRRFEHLFFSGLALLILVAVLVGFAHTYFLAGLFWAPLRNPLLHVHGAVFTLWILLFVTQTSLVAAGRVDLHRRLGIFGMVVACLLVILGVLIATQSLADDGKPGAEGFGKRGFYAVSLSDMLMFATLIWFALRNRSRPAVHKRLALIATLSILDAAYDRWPVPVPWWDDRVTPLICTYPVLILLMCYDWWSTRRVQRVTLWASAFLVVVQQGRDPLGRTAIWQSFADWVYLHTQSWTIFHGSM
jgi:hypothetical protein